ADPNDYPDARLPPDALQAEPPAPVPVLEPADDEPPRPVRRPRPRPHPGFWWSLLWCVGFWVVTVVVIPVVVFVIALFVRMAASGHARDYIKQFEGFQKGDLSPELALLFMPAMLAQEVCSIFIAWLAIRLVVGREWPRRLAFRPPAMTHLLFG